ncbi:MAG: ferritin-like domain-containing protein [Gemmataceae bacterium]
MKKLTSMEDLYVHELRDLYSAENQLIKALPKMAKAVSSDDLKEALETHLEETMEQAKRLETICRKLGINPKGQKCKAMEGLLEEGKESMELEVDDPQIRDAAIIAAAQRVEHYEIAGYGCARTFAELLGEDEAAELLQTTLDEEAGADKKLTEVAQSINMEAMAE